MSQTDRLWGMKWAPSAREIPLLQKVNTQTGWAFCQGTPTPSESKQTDRLRSWAFCQGAPTPSESKQTGFSCKYGGADKFAIRGTAGQWGGTLAWNHDADTRVIHPGVVFT